MQTTFTDAPGISALPNFTIYCLLFIMISIFGLVELF